jgi:hypothetical protein
MKNVLKQRGIDVFSASSSEAHGRTRRNHVNQFNRTKEQITMRKFLFSCTMLAAFGANAVADPFVPPVSPVGVRNCRAISGELPVTKM